VTREAIRGDDSACPEAVHFLALTGRRRERLADELFQGDGRSAVRSLRVVGGGAAGVGDPGRGGGGGGVAAWRVPATGGLARSLARSLAPRGVRVAGSQRNGEPRRMGAEPRAVTLAPLISCTSAIFALAFRPRMGVANRDHPFVHPSPCTFARDAQACACTCTSAHLPLPPAVYLPLVRRPLALSRSSLHPLSVFLVRPSPSPLSLSPCLSLIRTSLQRLPRRVFFLRSKYQLFYSCLARSRTRARAHARARKCPKPYYREISYRWHLILVNTRACSRVCRNLYFVGGRDPPFPFPSLSFAAAMSQSPCATLVDPCFLAREETKKFGRGDLVAGSRRPSQRRADPA